MAIIVLVTQNMPAAYSKVQSLQVGRAAMPNRSRDAILSLTTLSKLS
jgi:hypothetical protein